MAQSVGPVFNAAAMPNDAQRLNLRERRMERRSSTSSACSWGLSPQSSAATTPRILTIDTTESLPLPASPLEPPAASLLPSEDLISYTTRTILTWTHNPYNTVFPTVLTKEVKLVPYIPSDGPSQ